MSDETSPQLVLFVALVVIATGVATTFIDSGQRVAASIDDRGDTVSDRLRTDLTLLEEAYGSPYNSSNDTVTVLVKNTGERTLDPPNDTLDVFLDGAYVPDPTVRVVGGGRWRPGAVAEVRLDATLADGTHRVKVSTGGVHDTVQFQAGLDPVARTLVGDRSLQVGGTTTFDGRLSYDPDGVVTSYAWDLDGDGTTDATGKTASETYEDPGTYEVTLTVTDNEGNTDVRRLTVNVSDS